MAHESEPLKIGELARRTGLTVRTLHHYDEIGLLRPSLHTESGHRLYTAADIARLQQILSLKQLGFALEDIRACLERTDFSPRATIRLHAARLREQLELQNKLVQRLDDLAGWLDHVAAAGEVPADRFLEIIEVMQMIESYYTKEQLEQLKQRREEIGDEAIRAAEQEWPQLIAAMQAEMEANTDPADPKVQALAKRWRELVNAFTGGDPGIRGSLGKLWKEQGPNLAQQFQMPFDMKLFEYVNKAHAAAGESC
ncbi:MAG: MerR family transcriptional regulator [Gemmataceae bacterium]